MLAPALASALVLLALLARPAQACNEAVCASIVSKCTLLKSCECEIKPNQPCSCCDRCKKCLDYLLTECCSCFGLCRKPNVTELAHESVVFDFDSPEPTLWDAIVGQTDVSVDSEEDKWDVFTYPVDLHPAEVHRPKKGLTSKADSAAQETLVIDKEDKVTVNCTVAFLRECMPKNKCSSSCTTMGASHGRWFADGCCECVGHNCRDYGVNEAR